MLPEHIHSIRGKVPVRGDDRPIAIEGPTDEDPVEGIAMVKGEGLERGVVDLIRVSSVPFFKS